MGAKKASTGRDIILLTIEQHPWKMLRKENQSKHIVEVKREERSAVHDRTLAELGCNRRHAAHFSIHIKQNQH